MDKQVVEGSEWFLISKKWMDAWEKYVYFDEVNGTGEGEKISENERVKPGKIDNSDIILTPPEGAYLKDSSNKTAWQNTLLRPRIKEGEDFLLVDFNVFSYLFDIYSAD